MGLLGHLAVKPFFFLFSFFMEKRNDPQPLSPCGSYEFGILPQVGKFG